GRLALTTTVRVVDRVHGDTADPRAAAQPPAATGLADPHGGVLAVAERADGGPAVQQDHPHLARRHADLGELALLGHQLAPGAGGADHLRAPPRLQLHVVDQGAQRDRAQGQRIARLRVDVLAREDAVADLQALGPEDVALLAVHILDEGDAGR